MSFSRRSFLLGAGSGLSLLVVTACVEESPRPTRPATPSPTPSSAVPRPSGIERSAWSTDPFARGSQSFLAPGATPQHRDDLAQPVGGRVFFAGEATSADLAITYQVDTHSEPAPRLADLGDLSPFLGLREINGRGKTVPAAVLSLGGRFDWEKYF